MGDRQWRMLLLIALIATQCSLISGSGSKSKSSSASMSMSSTMSGMMLPHSAIVSFIQSRLPSGDYDVSELSLLTRSSVESIAKQSSTLEADLGSVIKEVQDHQTSMSSLLADMTYLQEMFSLFPSLVPAESRIASSMTASPSLVEEISLQVTKPQLADFSSVSKMKSNYPSLEAAFDAVTDAEVSFPEVTTVQRDLESVEKSDPDFLSQFASVNSMLTTTLSLITTIVVNIPCIDAENQVVEYATLAELTPSLSTYLEKLKAIELSNESLRSAENQIAYYMLQYPSAVKAISKAYDDDSQSASDEDSSVRSVEKDYPSLESCFDEISSAEMTNSALSTIQPAFDQALLEDSSLFLRASTLIDRDSPSLFSAERSISDAEKACSSIVTDINYVDAIELSTPTLRVAEDLLDGGSTSTAIHEMSEPQMNMMMMSSGAMPAPAPAPAQATASVSTATGAMHEINSIEESHPQFASVQSIIETVEKGEPYIFSDVSYMNKAVVPSLVQAEGELAKGEVTTDLLLTEVSYIDMLEVSYPSWITAESKIEYSEVASPGAVTNAKLYLAGKIEPDQTGITSFVGSHSTLLGALRTIESLTQSSVPLARIQDTLESAEQSVPSLLTDVSRIMKASSPTEYIAEYELESGEADDSSLLSDLSYVKNIDQLHSSLLTANQQLALDEQRSPSIVTAVDADLDADSDEQTDLPSSINPAVGEVEAIEKSFPSLPSVETDILSVERSESSLMSDDSDLASVESLLSKQLLTAPAVVCTVMEPNVEVFDYNLS